MSTASWQDFRRKAVGGCLTSCHRDAARKTRHVVKKRPTRKPRAQSRAPTWTTVRWTGLIHFTMFCGQVCDFILSWAIPQRHKIICGVANLVIPTARVLGARHVSPISRHDYWQTSMENAPTRHKPSLALTVTGQTGHHQTIKSPCEAMCTRCEKCFRIFLSSSTLNDNGSVAAVVTSRSLLGHVEWLGRER